MALPRFNALITILGVIVGGSIWGIPGAFLATKNLPHP